MKVVFVELPAFERHRAAYLDDDGFRDLQNLLITKPRAGDVMPGTGGLRKLRFPDARRDKGKRGGLRVIYFCHEAEKQIWLFTLYDKAEVSDLKPKERRALRQMIKAELKERTQL